MENGLNMKILLLTDNYPPIISVSSIRVSEFVKTFSSQGDSNIKVVTFNPEYILQHKLKSTQNCKNVEITRYERRYVPKLFYISPPINPILLLNWFLITTIESYKYKPDIIITSVPTISPTISASIYGNMSRTPTCIDLRDNWINPKVKNLILPSKIASKFPKNKLFKGVYKILLSISDVPANLLFTIFYAMFIGSCNSASIISSVYDNTLSDLAKYTKFNKHSVIISNGISIDELNSIKNNFDKEKILLKYGIILSNNTKLIIFVGSLGSYYRPGVLLNHIKHLIDKGINIKYLIVTNGNLPEKINEEIHDLHLEDYVYYIGKKPHNEVLELLLCSDIAFYALDDGFPTPDAALGVKVLEYTACKLPILSIAPADSSVTKFINVNKIGIALKWSELELVENSLMRLLNDNYYRINIELYYEKFNMLYNRDTNNKKLYLALKEICNN